MTTDGATKPVPQVVGDQDAVACNPEGDACALPPDPHS